MRKYDYLLIVLFVVLFGLHGIVYPLFISDTYLRMFEEFNSTLPMLTKIVLSKRFAVVISIIPVTIFGLAMTQKALPTVRTRVILISVIASALIIGIIVLGLGLPIHVAEANIQEG